MLETRRPSGMPAARQGRTPVPWARETLIRPAGRLRQQDAYSPVAVSSGDPPKGAGLPSRVCTFVPC
ncbi:hypothetical protein [Scytonema sp. PRP1]|uniref:hypothetical protein n=1 Tax=Scytonema sp. PRP1 TaxID=3120513 RepID=UPI002FD34A90